MNTNGHGWGQEQYGQERQESQEELAERLVAKETRQRGWTEETLAQRRKGDDSGVDSEAVADGKRGQLEYIAVSLAPQKWAFIRTDPITVMAATAPAMCSKFKVS